ncbi:DUF2865 domain-containing protein [Roseiarcaceae bacterium H3SJ34-1]|uniref:DUF2865 domain-containing protein n=1 Tax=Terripilifer ovatus TaxID=3032367 RepID=UPI003AB9AF4C|nr:DUF2865 domain-containing protein [Roseiarcaceae bacterium H3SJ34-1]
MFRAYLSSESAGALRPRTIAAFTAALFVVATAGFILGPDLRAGWAQSDESSAAYWRAERQRQSARTYEAAPARVTAYAPAPQQMFSNLHVPSIFRSGLPGGPEGNLAGGLRDKRKARQKSTEQKSKATAVRGKPATDKKLDRPAIASTANAVCVRLCDGFHFPAGDQATGSVGLEASCNTMCPGAPTRVYYSRSDRIEDAVAMRTGKSYRALPVALRYASTRDNTCTCRTDGLPGLQSVDVNRDPTLRRGDPVMTDAGFRIFRGAARMPYRPRDFASLAESRGVTPVSHTILVAMERASGIRPASRALPANARAGNPRDSKDAANQKNAELESISRFVPIPAMGPEPHSVVRLIGPQALYMR